MRKRWSLLVALTACAEPEPDLLTTSFVDPADLARVSMYRSCCGHDYSGLGESNRSMKHYLHPLDSFAVSNDQLEVVAPFDGRVFRIAEDSRYLDCFGEPLGHRMYLRPDAQPGVYIKLFHVNPQVEEGPVSAGDLVAFGDLRDCDVSNPSQVAEHPTSFDIALERRDQPFPVFDSMTPDAFAAWEAAGIASPSDLVIPEAVRDADPCTDYWQECADGMIGLWGEEAYPPWW
ncbi:MAG: hypothetical protein EP330_22745 [Deltaproteobacteria bacterium]|nr:MAG: hypothetical protein EP330_22745 [Deltaproteobacteria bacterium]